jgi:uncharacterized protein YbaR (Trm112 family)/ubiquinone/menaquinone biosynthesis C-methylase UbiE
MKESLLSILACPHCQADLSLQAEEQHQTEIISGSLHCSGCHRAYAIEQGVPCLLYHPEANLTRQAFSDQWGLRFEGEFDQEDRVWGLDPDKRAKWLLTQFVDPVQKGEWILDAGCGSAEGAYALARQRPEAEVVGLDFNHALKYAAQEAKNVPNLHFVQGDVMHPPFKAGSFMKLYSLGVLHSTPDTAQAFRAIAPLVASKGRLIVWLYPDPWENPLWIPYYAVRDIGFLGQGHRLPLALRRKLVDLHALGMLPLFAGYNMLRKLGVTSTPADEDVFVENMSLSELYKTLAFGLFDNVSPEYQFRHKKQEVMQWFAENGFVEIKAGPIEGTFSGKRV